MSDTIEQKDAEIARTKRFTIRWADGAYKVSIPNYDGGEVVAADDYDRLGLSFCVLEAKYALAAEIIKEERVEIARLKAEVDRLNAVIRAVEKPPRISAKSLYERLVLKLLTYWGTLYPMVEWTDPESAVDRIMATLTARGVEVQRLRERDAAWASAIGMRRSSEVGTEGKQP